MKLVEFDIQTGTIRGVVPSTKDATSRNVYVVVEDSLGERIMANPTHFFLGNPTSPERRCMVYRPPAGGRIVNMGRVASLTVHPG